jgi:hypothetical protein
MFMLLIPFVFCKFKEGLHWHHIHIYHLQVMDPQLALGELGVNTLIWVGFLTQGLQKLNNSHSRAQIPSSRFLLSIHKGPLEICLVYLDNML